LTSYIRLRGDHDAADRLVAGRFGIKLHFSRLGDRLHDRLGLVRRAASLNELVIFRALQASPEPG